MRLKFKSSFFEEPVSLSREHQLLVLSPQQNPLLDEAAQVRQLELNLKAHTGAVLDAATGGYRLSDNKVEQVLLCLENIKRLRLKFSVLVQSWIGKYLKTLLVLLQSLAHSSVASASAGKTRAAAQMPQRHAGQPLLAHHRHLHELRQPRLPRQLRREHLRSTHESDI